MRLLILAGHRSARVMDAKMRELHPRYLQVDEIWTFVQKKACRVRSSDLPEVGDRWVFVAIDAETKLIPAFFVGKRTREDTTAFLWDLYGRLAAPVQLTTDGLVHYTRMVPECFGLDVDFAQLVKLFGDFGQYDNPEGRYSPPRIAEVISKVRLGDPDPDHISTRMHPAKVVIREMQSNGSFQVRELLAEGVGQPGKADPSFRRGAFPDWVN